jgi:hypothetical protein
MTERTPTQATVRERGKQASKAIRRQAIEATKVSRKGPTEDSSGTREEMVPGVMPDITKVPCLILTVALGSKSDEYEGHPSVPSSEDSCSEEEEVFRTSSLLLFSLFFLAFGDSAGYC